MENKDRIAELEQRRRWALEMGGPEQVQRQHGAGKQTIRERITSLVDEDSFQEVGRLTGTSTLVDGKPEKVVPAPYVMGLAAIAGNPVAVGGEDFTVKGGTAWGSTRRKGGQGGFVEDLAHEYRIPLINLIDGAGGSVTSAGRGGYTVFPGVHGFERSVQLMGEVPVVSAVMGTAAGGPAGRAILSHFSVMVAETSQIFAAGPPVVERSLGEKVSKEALGGAALAVDRAGTIDNVALNEAECVALIRRFLAYMPQNVWELPPRRCTGDPAQRAEQGLLDIVPEQRRRAYDMRRLLRMVVDVDSLLEIQPSHGKAVITALARLDGYPVGVIANNPLIYGGAMDSAAARKQAHFVELCDTFHIPLLFLVDLPGFMVGTKAEEEATLRAGMSCVYVTMQATVPMFTVVIRKCYGMAGMGTCDKNGLDFQVGWPTAEWGSLPIEGGVAAAYRRDIAGADDPKQREQELEEELRAYASPFLTAEAFAVEDIIDPRETRPLLCRFIAAAQGKLRSSVGVKYRSGVRP